MRKMLISLFFLLQVVAIVYSRFSEERYFCWAPFDQISVFEIQAKINGVEFSPAEVRSRYKMQSPGRENRAIQNVFSIIKQFEQSYGKEDAVVVKVIYSTNGKAKEEWSFSTE